MLVLVPQRMRGRGSFALLGAALLCALVAGRATAAPRLLVGVDDDGLKWAPTPAPIVAIDKDLGLGAVRVRQWQPGLSRLDPASAIYVQRAEQAAKLGDRVVLAIYGPAATPPNTTTERANFCSFAVAALGSARNIYDVIWNEANPGSLATAAGSRRRLRGVSSRPATTRSTQRARTST